jgi:hypothetical protein
MNGPGPHHWNEIAQKLNTRIPYAQRTGKQCRERWINHLSPEVVKKGWSLEEELILGNAIYHHGSKWSDISRLLAGRSDNAIKNHYYSTIRKTLRILQRRQQQLAPLRPVDIKEKEVIGLLMDEEDCDEARKALRRHMFVERAFAPATCLDMLAQLDRLQHRAPQSPPDSLPQMEHFQFYPLYYFNQLQLVVL